MSESQRKGEAKYFLPIYLQLQESHTQKKKNDWHSRLTTNTGQGIHAIFFLVVDFFLEATVRVLLDWNSEDGPLSLRVRGRPPLERSDSQIFVAGFRRGFGEDGLVEELPEGRMGGKASLGLDLLVCKAAAPRNDFVLGFPLLLRCALFEGAPDFLGISTATLESEYLTWSLKWPLLEIWRRYEQTMIN